MCISPIRIRHPTKSGVFLDVPCGKCLECVRKRSNDLAFRLIEQMKSSNTAYFITLTYDDNFMPFLFINENDEIEFKARLRTDLPSNRGCPYYYDFLDGDDSACSNYNEFYMCFYKPDVQKFIRSIRDEFRYYAKKHKINAPVFKYFFSSEYGGKTLRPHYHGILFGLPSDLKFVQDLVAKHWKYGFSSVSACNEKRCYYASKYALKGAAGIDLPSECIDKPFILLSNGLGLSFLTPEMEAFIKPLSGELNLSIHQQGREKLLPRYYRDKIFTSDYDKIRLRMYFENIELEKDIPESASNPFRYRDEDYKRKLQKVKFSIKQEKL